MSGPTIATTNAKDTFTKDTKISFARTSDAVGSHNTFHNIDASLNLIRRRILQRCNSIHELLMVIRRIKITESKFITLSEFKHVLVKFGVILDSEVISQVFGKFCDGRTGSMDFEGFARWVNMPEGGVIAKGAKRDKGGAAAKMTTNGSGGNGVALNKAQEMQVRQKLLDVMTYLPSIFGSGSIVTEIDFDGLSSAVFNLDAPGLNKITDREIRTLFATLDTNKSGMVNIATITKYAQTGQVVLPAIKHCLADRDFSLIPSLETCISRVCGTDRSVAHKCFSKLPRNSPLKLKFSEFQKLLLTEGLGRNTSDAEELFIALGGDDDNSADIGLLLATLAKMKADEEEEQKKMIMKKPNVMEFPLSKEQRKAIAMARGVDFLEETKMQASYSDGQFDRTNRMRAEGPPLTAGTALIQTIGTSRAERHFREAIRKSYKVVKDECKVLDHNNTGYIDAEQLLKVVNKYCQAIPMEDFRFILQPVRADERGRVSWQHFLFVYNPSKDLHPLTHTIAGVKHGGAAHGHGHGHGHESTFGSKSNLGMGLSGTNSPLPGISGSPHKGMSRANSPPKLNLQMQASSNNNDLETQFNKKLKKCWQKLLKECQMIDSKRTGQIDQDSFEKAIQTSGLEQVSSVR